MKLGTEVSVMLAVKEYQQSIIGTVDGWDEHGLLIKVNPDGHRMFFPWTAILFVEEVKQG